MKRMVWITAFIMLLMLACLPLAQAEQGSASIEDAVTVFLQTEMQKQAEEATDGWQRFLYEQGIAEVTMNLEKFDVEKGKPLAVSFQMAGGQPSVKKQPEYEGNAEEWLKGIVDAMRTRDTTVKTSLTITAEGGGYTVELAPKAEASLQKSVKSLASKAAKAFSNKTILSAVTDYLMPTPIAIPKKAPKALSPDDYQAAFTDYVARNALDLDDYPTYPALLYGIRGYKLNVADGPEAFVLSYSVPDIDALFETTSDSLNYDICFDENAKKYETEEVRQLVVREFEKNIIASRSQKKGLESEAYTFNFLELPEKIDPEAFYTHAESTSYASLADALSTVQLSIVLMPDYPAQPNPKTGVINGSNNGTKCIFKVYDDGYSRCINVYNTSTDKLYSTIFIPSGKSATVRIPKGDYYFVIGAGEVWYGPEHLFGNLGGYYKTEDITIYGSKYYHTFTLNPKKEGNTETYSLNYDDMFK